MIEQVIDERRRSLGGSLEVGRVLPVAARRMVGPFVFFDHMGPVELPAGLPDDADVRPHPHIGLATITYLFDGEITHRDSLGSEQDIRPGEVNWMTAGRGITHSERFERARREGARLHGIQSWIALPQEFEETDPAFAHHATDALPAFGENGAQGRLIIGEAFGERSPVATLSPTYYLHWTLAPGGHVPVPQGYRDNALYVAQGSVEIDGQPFRAGQMIVLAPGAAPSVISTEPSIVMALGGEPLGERFLEWNFVSSSRERIEQAKADWRAGRMRLPVHDDAEFIPLPPDLPGVHLA
jgi:redox-sensitive bicupin YhaK (pirin superfamily)